MWNKILYNIRGPQGGSILNQDGWLMAAPFVL